MSQEYESTDCAMRHYMRDVIILLGGRKDVADILDLSLDRPPTDEEVNRIRNYAIDLFTDVKTRLNNLHKLSITVKPDADGDE